MISIEKATQLRRFTLMIGAGAFLAAQLALQDHDWEIESTSGLVAIGGMVLWAGALLIVLGPWLWRRRWRALEDERASLVRSRAFSIGYAAMIIAAVFMFALAVVGEVEALEAVHLILAAGIAAPMFGFAFLD